MATPHFERLGTLLSTILAANDRIVNSGTPTDGESGSRFIHLQRHNVPVRLFSHPGDARVDVEAVYRPSNVYNNEMTDAEIKQYAQRASIETDDPQSLRKEVISHKVISLHKEIEFETAYEPVLEADSITAPQTNVLPLQDYPDEPDGFVVSATLYPNDPTFGISTYTDTVSELIKTRVDLSRKLHTNLGLDDLNEDPTEQEPNDPGTQDDNLPSFA